MASEDDAITRRSPSGAASMMPAAPTSSTSDAAVDKQREDLHHVEVSDERVSELHERPGEQGFSRHRLPSSYD